MFTVKKQGGAEINFLNLWQTISYFFEVQGFHAGEGNAMGLAAAKTGLMIRFDSEDKFPFFKDNIEKVRIKHGQSNIKDKNIYFDTHKKIEYPKRPFWKKAIDKLTKKAVFLYRFLKVRYLANKDIEFKKLL